MALDNRLRRLERRVGLDRAPDDEDDDAEAVRAWRDELRTMWLEIKLGRAPTAEELAVELAREVDVEALDRETCRRRFQLHQRREPSAEELDAEVARYKAELAEAERQPGYRRFISPASREYIRQMVAGELERSRQRRREGAPHGPIMPDAEGQPRPELEERI